MIEAARNKVQKVVTGVCIIGIAEKSRAMLADSAELRFGAISDRQMNAHLECGGWIGRAGRYNIEELVTAGWPVEWHWTADENTETYSHSNAGVHGGGIVSNNEHIFPAWFSPAARIASNVYGGVVGI